MYCGSPGFRGMNELSLLVNAYDSPRLNISCRELRGE